MSKKVTKKVTDKVSHAKELKRIRDAKYRSKKRDEKNKSSTLNIFDGSPLLGPKVGVVSFELKLNPAVRGIFNSVFANISSKIAHELAGLLNAFDENINALIKDGLKCHGDGCEKCRKCIAKGTK